MVNRIQYLAGTIDRDSVTLFHLKIEVLTVEEFRQYEKSNYICPD